MELFVGGTAALATVVLAILTGRYVKLTGNMVEEMRLARGASVFVDLEFKDRSRTLLVVGNSGNLPAKNIQIRYSDRAHWGRRGFERVDALQHGISYLAPGRHLKYEVGFIDWKRVSEVGGNLTFRIRYTANDGKEMKHQAVFDLAQYVGGNLNAFRTDGEIVATAIEQLQRSRDTSLLFSRFQPKKKRCPSCCEFVLEQAKKCVHCLEFIEDNGGAEPPNIEGEKKADGA